MISPPSHTDRHNTHRHRHRHNAPHPAAKKKKKKKTHTPKTLEPTPPPTSGRVGSFPLQTVPLRIAGLPVTTHPPPSDGCQLTNKARQISVMHATPAIQIPGKPHRTSNRIASSHHNKPNVRLSAVLIMFYALPGSRGVGDGVDSRAEDRWCFGTKVGREPISGAHVNFPPGADFLLVRIFKKIIMSARLPVTHQHCYYR